MNEYTMYKQASDSIKEIILNKEDEIITIENEITNLKKTRRMLDEEFNKNLNKKENYLG